MLTEEEVRKGDEERKRKENRGDRGNGKWLINT